MKEKLVAHLIENAKTNDFEKRLDELTTENTKLTSRLDLMSSRLEQLTDDNARLKSVNADLENRIKSMWESFGLKD